VGSERIDELTTRDAIAPGTSAPGPGRPEQVAQLAREFEAMLMTQMLRELRHTVMSDDSSSSGLGGGAWSDTMDVELGRALGQSGGVGLASVLLRSLERQTAPNHRDAGDTGSPSGALPEAAAHLTPHTAAVPAAAGDATALVPARSIGSITSGFGWRRDPFTQTPRFHTGVDIALAYGTPVRAAASGTVVFSGVNGAYGNTVVIEQAAGQQMRYAHLSAQAVQAGDVVASGEVIGRSGDSGRATAAHLHFEVLQNGQPVDPVVPD
jgi:murein DD-endopeptidase MepM/ murein hydrolase activator NlpD